MVFIISNNITLRVLVLFIERLERLVRLGRNQWCVYRLLVYKFSVIGFCIRHNLFWSTRIRILLLLLFGLIRWSGSGLCIISVFRTSFLFFIIPAPWQAFHGACNLTQILIIILMICVIIPMLTTPKSLYNIHDEHHPQQNIIDPNDNLGSTEYLSNFIRPDNGHCLWKADRFIFLFIIKLTVAIRSL